MDLDHMLKRMQQISLCGFFKNLTSETNKYKKAYGTCYRNQMVTTIIFPLSCLQCFLRLHHFSLLSLLSLFYLLLGEGTGGLQDVLQGTQRGVQANSAVSSEAELPSIGDTAVPSGCQVIQTVGATPLER